MDARNQHDASLNAEHKTIGEFEVIDHGIEHEQYFRGCGLSHSTFTGIATGCGNDPREAVDDAIEQLACGGWDVTNLDKRIVADGWFGNRRKIPAKPSVPVRSEDSHYYLSIRVKEAGPDEGENRTFLDND